MKFNVKYVIQKIPPLYTFFLRIRLMQRALFRHTPQWRVLFLLWLVRPYTMVGHERLFNVYDLSCRVTEQDLEGAFVECGVWRGGCSAVMASVAEREGRERITWLFDSFEGLPEPTREDGEQAAADANQRISGKLAPIKKDVGSLEDVEKLFFKILKLPHRGVYIIRGWFQDTLASQREAVGPIAILRLDADWYESTKCILENLYDNVVRGGYVIVDDYGSWEGCRKAVDEFLKNRDIHVSLQWIDTKGIYFQKP